MAYFQTKNHNLSNFFSGLQWKRSVYFMAISSILTDICNNLWPFWHICGLFRYIFLHFGKYYQEKSGNSSLDAVGTVT
jgi:hypothetical protein